MSESRGATSALRAPRAGEETPGARGTNTDVVEIEEMFDGRWTVITDFGVYHALMETVIGAPSTTMASITVDASTPDQLVAQMRAVETISEFKAADRAAKATAPEAAAVERPVSPSGCNHDPDPDTTCTKTCLPADLRREGDYPASAKCLLCGEWICKDQRADEKWHLKYPERS